MITIEPKYWKLETDEQPGNPNSQRLFELHIFNMTLGDIQVGDNVRFVANSHDTKIKGHGILTHYKEAWGLYCTDKPKSTESIITGSPDDLTAFNRC